MPSITSTAKAWQSAGVEAIVLLLGAFGATGALWAWQNRASLREESHRKRLLATMLDESAQVMVHLAKHAAASRNQPLGNIHVLYAIVQDERVAEALREVGGDYAAIEAAIDRAMDQAPAEGDPREGTRMLGSALGLAQAHAHAMTLTDVLVLLARTEYGKQLLDVPPGTAHALLFRLVHGSVPPATLPQETWVHVVIRNDDVTTQQFVVAILRDVFELGEADAVAKMRGTHETGRAIVGRFTAAAARDKIEAARRKAVEHVMPLWIGVEVC
jgi:ATP-dependent Clp protease adaptor protein ClpS